MKKINQLLVLILMAFPFISEAQDAKENLETVYFKSSMDCHQCEITLTDYLKFEKGLKDLKIDLKSNTIKVVYKAGKNTKENLAKGIQKKGYEANSISESEYQNLVAAAAKK